MATKKWTDDSLYALRKEPWYVERERRTLSAAHPERRIQIEPSLYLFLRLRKSDVAFQWQSRMQIGGKRKWIALGEFRPNGSGVGIADARKKLIALNEKKDAAKEGDGDHPVIEVQRARKAKAQAPTVASVFDEMIAAKQRGSPRKGGKPVRERTVFLLRQPFDADVKDSIGERKIAKLTKSEIENCVNAALDRGSPGAAAQTYRVLKMLIRYGIKKDYLSENVMEGIDNPRPWKPSETVNAATNDAELVNILRSVETSQMWPSTKHAIHLALLTGARSGEIRSAEIRHFNLKKRTWTIPAENTKMDKPFTMHLSTQAVAVIKEAMQLVDGKYLFVGATKEQIAKDSINKALRRIHERNDDDGKRYRPHDLRRTFKTTLSRLGVAPHVSELCLSHQNKDVLQRAYDGYNYLPEMIAAWDKIGAHIESIMGGGATVIPILRKA